MGVWECKVCGKSVVSRYELLKHCKLKQQVKLQQQSDDIELKRDCILKSLCAYLNEDSNTDIKEYLSANFEDAKSAIAQTTVGLSVMLKEGADEDEQPEDVGVVIEGVELLNNLRSISCGVIMLFGLIYALNLSYPSELKFTFEFFQKVLMNLDGKKTVSEGSNT
uniref:Uncharacterized protein n=1 Tax=Mastacembelus armatus TaxID=205130 RepID=A0A3Q3M7G1_9TELE